ncbi:MAG: NACHT domain-containing protein, partial [Pleurocapsa sp. MO_226.B13]|nr:NACHT domain-containing protein [Pleurocapsa sp. MO_226.B13]
MPKNEPELQSVRDSEESTNSRQKARQKRVQKVIKYLGLSGTGIGISGIIGLLVKGQFKAATLLGLFTIAVTLLAIAYKFVSGVTNRVLDLIEEELENLEEPVATWIVNQPKRFVIWLWWWKLNSQFQAKYYQSLIDTFRELKIEGFRIGLPVLDLENVFVSLRVVPKIPEKITGAMIGGEGDSGSQVIWDFLAQSNKKKFQAFRRLAVIGWAGSGKTTLLKHLTLIYAKKQNKVYKAPKLIPVLLYLRDIRRLIVTEQPPSLPKLIREHIKKLPTAVQLTPPANWIEERLKIGKFLVMLDGLDEVANSDERTQVSQWVNRQIETYRKNVFILTSRPHGYRSAPVEQVGTVLKVLPFNSKQVKQFIQSWYLQTEIMSRAGRDTPAVRSEAKNNADDLIERIMDNRAIADMAKNPLLVTMIATVHYCGSALPGRRVELYQKICDLLLGSRQKAKKIKSPLTAEQNKSVLQVLALALMERKIREFNPNLGQELIDDELKSVASNSLTAAEFLIQMKEVSGLLVERELGVYEFAHLSFQEYLAAAQVRALQQDNLLTENLQDPWWAETIRLYAAQSDASNLITAALSENTVAALKLALDCQEEGLRIKP